MGRAMTPLLSSEVTVCTEPSSDTARVSALSLVSTILPILPRFPVFFFNDTATTEIYTLSLHDALPIFVECWRFATDRRESRGSFRLRIRSEEHTSELQSPKDLVCRLLLEKKKE